jgi:hypothetical protein
MQQRKSGVGVSVPVLSGMEIQQCHRLLWKQRAFRNYEARYFNYMMTS